MRCPTLLAALLLGFSLAGSPAGASPIEDLLRADGTITFLEDVPVTLDSALRVQAGEESDSYDATRLLNRFAATRLRVRMLEILGIRWRMEDGRRMEEWFESSLGQKIRASERALTGPEAQRLMGAYVATFGRLGGGEERVALADRILVARGDVRRLETVARATVALSLAAVAGGGRSPDLDAPEVDEAIDELLPELEERARWRVLFSHRSLTLDEIRRHAELLESDAARWYHGLVDEALGLALEEAVSDLGKDPSSED